MSAASQDEVFQLVIDILRAEFEVEPAKLLPDASLQDDLDLDSIDAVDLVARLEEETGVKVGDEELAGVRTLSDVARVVLSGLGRRSAAS